jgi:hypothetical protein
MMYKEEAKFRDSASESNDAMDGAVVDVASGREWFLEVDAPEHGWTEYYLHECQYELSTSGRMSMSLGPSLSCSECSVPTPYARHQHSE